MQTNFDLSENSITSFICNPDDIPVVSDGSLNIFSAISPCIPDTNTSIQKVKLLDKSVSEFKYVLQRLEEAKAQSTKQKIYSLVSVASGVAIIATSSIFAYMYGETTGFPAAGIIAGTVSFFALNVIGSISDHISGEIQAKDLGTRFLDTVLAVDDSAPFVLPFYPIVAVNRIFNRVQNLENRINALRSEANENNKLLKKYFTSFLIDIEEQIKQKITNLDEDLSQVSSFHSAFIDEKKRLTQEVGTLNKALNELQAVTSFYKG